MKRRFFREALLDISTSFLVIVLAVGIGAAVQQACASAPPKQVATIDVQNVEKLLATLQDTATQLCLPNPPTHCTASAVIFTDAQWHTFNAALVPAFDAQIQLATALKAWTPGTGTPPSIATIAGQANAIIVAVNALPVSAQEKQILAEAQAVVVEIGNIGALIQSAQASAGSGS